MKFTLVIGFFKKGEVLERRINAGKRKKGKKICMRIGTTIPLKNHAEEYPTQ